MCSGLQLKVLGHHRFLLLRSLCGRLGGRSRCASRSAHLCARLPTFESNCPAWWKVPVNDFASGSQLATEQTSVDGISKQSPGTETSPPFLAHGIATERLTHPDGDGPVRPLQTSLPVIARRGKRRRDRKGPETSPAEARISPRSEHTTEVVHLLSKARERHFGPEEGSGMMATSCFVGSR